MRGKLRYFYEIDVQGNPIAGSLRAGRKIPSGGKRYVELFRTCCGDDGDEDNDAPVASSVSISGTLTVGSTLTGSYTYSDTETNPEGTSLKRWYRADNGSGLNKALITGATGLTYVLTSTDLGKVIQFGVVPKATSGTITGTLALSAYSAAVGAAADVTPPTVLSMTATGANTIVVVFSEVVTGSTAGWVFNNGAGVSITSVAGSGSNTFTFTTSTTMAAGETITGAYTPGIVADLASNALAAFGATSVTNSIPPPALTAQWMSQVGDPHATLIASSDPFTYTGSAVLASTSANIVIDVHDALAYPDNDFFVIKVPSTVTLKTIWADDPVNAPFNNGIIPDSVFRAMVTFGGYNYYYTRVGQIWDHTVGSLVTLS